jgi:hypothetical protein
MAMEWGDYRDEVVRPLLKDTVSSAYQWSDEELLIYANWGIDDLSRTIPMVTSVDLTGTGPTYDLPADFQSVHSVALVDSTGGSTYFLPELDVMAESGWSFATPSDSSQPVGYLLDWPEEGKIFVSRLPSTGQELELRYWGLRYSVTEDDDELPFGRHRWGEQALAFYIAYVGHIRQSVGRAGLEQWSQRPDLQVGNPLSAEAREFLNAYNRLCSLHQRRN